MIIKFPAVVNPLGIRAAIGGGSSASGLNCSTDRRIVGVVRRTRWGEHKVSCWRLSDRFARPTYARHASASSSTSSSWQRTTSRSISHASFTCVASSAMGLASVLIVVNPCRRASTGVVAVPQNGSQTQSRSGSAPRRCTYSRTRCGGYPRTKRYQP